jgi:hypothetical protein
MASAELGKPSSPAPVGTRWYGVRPPDRPLWVVLGRAYDVRGNEIITISYASISPDRSHTEIFLEEFRRQNPHAIFELAEC